MKVREVIEINRTLTLQELYDFMQQHWDRERYNDFVLGGPAAGTFRDYIMLPATQRCVICVYPRKDKIIAAVMPNSEGQMTLAGSLVLHGYGGMRMTGEMRGVAAQANTLYASYLEKLLERAGMLSGSPKRECPVVARTNTDGDAGNVLDLVKIAPPESRTVSNLSFVLGIISMLLFFTGIPGLVLGVAAILAANSVLHKQGFQPRAYAGRFCAIVAVCMSSVVAFILIAGSIITAVNT